MSCNTESQYCSLLSTPEASRAKMTNFFPSGYNGTASYVKSKEFTKSEQNRSWKRNMFNVITTSSSVECAIANGHVMIVNQVTILTPVCTNQCTFFFLLNNINLLLLRRSRCRLSRSGLKFASVKFRPQALFTWFL